MPIWKKSGNLSYAPCIYDSDDTCKYICVSSISYISIYIYIYILTHPCRVEFSCKGSNGCHLCKVRLFEWIELSVAIKRIYVNKTKQKVIYKHLKFICLCKFLCSCALESLVGVWVSWVSIPASRISCALPHWRVVIQRNSLSEDAYIYIYIYIYIYTQTTLTQSVFKNHWDWRWIYVGESKVLQYFT